MGCLLLLLVNMSLFGMEQVTHYLAQDKSGDFEVNTKTLNFCVKVNKKSNELLNGFVYCSKLIEELVKTFGCSKEEACKGLQTQEARRILGMQDKVFKLCQPYYCPTAERCRKEYATNKNIRTYVTREELDGFVKNNKDLDTCIQLHQLKHLWQQGADLDFTYTRQGYSPQVRPFMVLCMTTSRLENDKGLDEIMQFFIYMHKKKQVDINATDLYGKSAFMHAWIKSDRTWVGRYFFKRNQEDKKFLKLNQQDIDGNTLIMHEVCHKDVPHGSYGALMTLVEDAGIDPKLGNYVGLTPLKKLEELLLDGVDVQDLLDYLRSAIEAKD